MDGLNNSKSCVVLYSGGMDSTVVLHHAALLYDKIYALSFNYNQRHERELACAKDYIFCYNNFVAEKNNQIEHKIIDLSKFGQQLSSSALTNTKLEVPKMKDVIGDPQTLAYVPNRNMLFLSMAASLAESVEANTIFYGAAKADDTSGYWDCTQEFRTLMNQILSLNRRNLIQIEAPLIDKTKKEIIEYGLELNVSFNITHTCYNNTEHIACGECPSCSARIAGWIQAGYKDPIIYNRDIPWEKYNCKDLEGRVSLFAE